jgi:hypothetical protein
MHLPSITPADAKKIEALHYRTHGIRGMIGSLDCSHFVWGNCPVAHHGQFQGKEGKPTIVMEAMCDYNLFAWHTVFGYSGVLNDINIWDSSLLHKAFCDGSFSTCDFSFEIGGETFHHLWLLVDGIYPATARFVKPLSVPVDDDEALFSLWQEAKRKDVERFFGVFKKKFNMFNNPIKLFYMSDIIHACYSCLILHNMSVLERVAMDDGTRENDIYYDVVNNDTVDVEDVPTAEVAALQFVETEEHDANDRLLQVEFLQALGINVHDATLSSDLYRIQILPQLTRMALARWDQLYDLRAHKRLTGAISRELTLKYLNLREARR